jgi:hypothetical protein
MAATSRPGRIAPLTLGRPRALRKGIEFHEVRARGRTAKCIRREAPPALAHINDAVEQIIVIRARLLLRSISDSRAARKRAAG